jgi:hypothetical protein
MENIKTPGKIFIRRRSLVMQFHPKFWMIFARLLKKKNREDRLVFAPDMWRTFRCFAA